MIKVWGRMSSTNVQKVMWCIDELGVTHEHIDLPHGHAKQDPRLSRDEPERAGAGDRG
jgi:glutathione S-transferase